MPLTPFQSELGRLLAKNRSEDSYLAGGAALLAEPRTTRYSQDLDYFHDSADRVSSAFNVSIPVAAERAKMLGLPTSFHLSGDQVDMTVRWGRELLLENSAFKDAVDELDREE